MTLPGLPSLLLLGSLFVLVPIASVRGARRLAPALEDRATELPISREAIWLRTIFNLGTLRAEVLRLEAGEAGGAPA